MRLLALSNIRIVISCNQFFVNQFIERGCRTPVQRKSDPSGIVSRGVRTATGISDGNPIDLSMCLNDRIVSFETWYAQQKAKLSSSTSATSCREREMDDSKDVPNPLMDLRSAADRAKRRLFFPKDTKISVVPFPIEYLKERSFELPGNFTMSCHALVE